MSKQGKPATLLPTWWPERGNQIESATHDDNADMEQVVTGLMNHPTHHDHMHGIGFWEASVCYGVGCSKSFFVCVTAPVEVEG